MFRRYFIPVLACVAFVLLTSLLVSAQNGQLRGHVTLKQADGTVVSAADAIVDVFRTDIGGQYQLKTNKKGEFVHAGIPVTGTYTVAVSMPGAQPGYVPNVKAGGDDDVRVELFPGDGKRLTRADLDLLSASDISAASAPAKEGAEDKAKRAELLKKNAEIAASNKKADESNAVVERTFKSGNEALNAKNYDSAIALYDEGIAADPDHPGAPSLMTNKSVALTRRGTARFNAALASKVDGEKHAGLQAAKKDWQAASLASAKAVALLRAMTEPTDPAAANSAKANLYFSLLARADAMRLLARVDQTTVAEGETAYREYLAVETDAAKRSKAEHGLAQMLFDANAYDKARLVYEKILTQTPDDADVLKNMGLICYELGSLKQAEGEEDEARDNYQLAANYLQQYVDKAPAGPMKSDAQDILKAMKEQQNVQPEKVTSPAPKRPDQ